MKILIVEDNFLIANNLSEILQEFGYTVFHARNSTDAEAIFDNENPDLLLLDIELEASAFNGIQLAEILISRQKVPHIFLTGKYKNQAYREGAKKTNPAYFLTKPVAEQQLEVAIDFALTTSPFEFANDISYKAQPTSKQTIKSAFFIKKNRLWIRIKTKDIIWIRASKMTSEIHLINDTMEISKLPLKEFLNHLDGAFIRTHKSYAINPDFVQSFDPTTIHLKYNNNTQLIPISESFRHQVRNALNQI